MPASARPGVRLFGAMAVLSIDEHEVICRRGWSLTRLVQRPDLAVCPGCGHLVQGVENTHTGT